jgi:hypothetical protein
MLKMIWLLAKKSLEMYCFNDYRRGLADVGVFPACIAQLKTEIT